MRIFVSITPPAETLSHIEQCIGTLSHINKRLPIKWSDRTLLHTTVLFIGEIEEGSLSRVQESLAEAASGIHEFYIDLGAPDIFLKNKRPSIIHMKVFDQSGTLKKLHDTLSLDIGRYCKLDEKPFSPHITLGRVKGNLPRNKKVAVSCGHVDSVFPVTVIDLVQSHVSSIGPHYTTLYSVSLPNA